jgi:hypothetical protein
VECVQALLGGGAAINQAAVGSTSSMARHRQGLFVGRVGACVIACVCSSGMAHVSGHGREVIEPMSH